MNRLDKSGARGPELITPDQYQLDAPDLGAIWQVEDILVGEYGGEENLDAEVLSEETVEELDDALRETTSQDVTGLVLDLRFNPGGLLKSTISVASQFLDDGLVLYQIDATGNRTDSQVAPGGLALDIPMVVLVNGFSASAAEVLAGALQDHGRADLIGSRTFGKSDGSAIDLTYALWYTPEGELIEGQGLVPDVIVPMDPRVGQGSALDVQLLVARQTLQNKIREPALVG